MLLLVSLFLVLAQRSISLRWATTPALSLETMSETLPCSLTWPRLSVDWSFPTKKSNTLPVSPLSSMKWKLFSKIWKRDNSWEPRLLVEKTKENSVPSTAWIKENLSTQKITLNSIMFLLFLLMETLLSGIWTLRLKEEWTQSSLDPMVVEKVPCSEF